MAWNGNQTSAEFLAGHTPLANTGKANENSLTLGDAGLNAASDRWDSLTPRGVIGLHTGQDDGSYERFQREQGGYAPGSTAIYQDQLNQGSDSTSWEIG